MVELPFDELKSRSVDGIGGLFTVVAQDEVSGEVLMVAYASREAVEKTLESGQAHYYSTSRGKLWMKGESSGHTQEVSEVLVDCDGDALIYRISEAGPACHKGYRTCFYRKIDQGELKATQAKAFDPDKVY